MSFMSVIGTLNQGAKVIRALRRIGHDVDTLKNSIGDLSEYQQSGYTQKGIQEQLKENKITFEKLQHSDVFFASIERVEPYYDPEKARLINTMLSSISIVHDGIEIKEEKYGSGYFNWIAGIQAGEIQATFNEFKENDILDMLTKVSNKNALSGVLDDVGIGASIRGVETTVNRVGGIVEQVGGMANALSGMKSIGHALSGFGIGSILGGGTAGGVGSGKNGNIMPSDGTLLLPYQYYFRIRISHIIADSNTKTAYEDVVIDDDYILEGSPSQEYTTGDEKYLQTSATFKPIKSWK